MADIYKSVTISGVTQTQNNVLSAAWEELDKRPMDIALYEYDSASQTVTVTVGVPAEANLLDITALVSRLRTAIRNSVGRFPNAAIDIQPGEKCMTARDRRYDQLSLLGKVWDNIKQAWVWLTG